MSDAPQSQDQSPVPVVRPARQVDPAASLKNRIAEMMSNPDNFKDDGQTPPVDDAPPVDDTPSLTVPTILPDRGTQDASTATSVPSPVAPTVPQGVGDEPKDFKTLRAALDQRDAKIKELESEVSKIRPNAEKVTRLEQELQAAQQDVNETKAWREKHNLLRSDEFQNTIAIPRQNIFETIKRELEADEIDANIWFQAQQATSRKDLEQIVNNNIESELLKGQFYQLFFQDLELRQKEAKALEAPAQYMQRIRDEEIANRNQQTELARQSFVTTWEAALHDATQMTMRLGENKLIETTILDDNPEHNERVVKPILEAAHQGARAALEERLAAGLPVNRQIAANVVYLWRQAVAAQAANQDRLRWYTTAQQLQARVNELESKLGTRTAIDNPVPGSRGPGRPTKVRGSTLQERIANFAQQMGAQGSEE